MPDNKEKDIDDDTLIKLLDRIAFGSAKKVTGATSKAGDLVSGIYGSVVPEILPDMQKIDEMVEVATISAYSLIAFGVTGTIFFTMKTVREFGQWRSWLRFNRHIRTRIKNQDNKPSSS